eukprot:2374624-Amphidinium_carterae.2
MLDSYLNVSLSAISVKDKHELCASLSLAGNVAMRTACARKADPSGCGCAKLGVQHARQGVHSNGIGGSVAHRASPF